MILNWGRKLIHKLNITNTVGYHKTLMAINILTIYDELEVEYIDEVK